jgi:hypothetical protein
MQLLLKIPVNTELPKETMEAIQKAKALHDYNEYIKQLDRVKRWHAQK